MTAWPANDRVLGMVTKCVKLLCNERFCYVNQGEIVYLGPKHHLTLREDASPDVVFGEAIHPGRPPSLYDEWPWWRKAWYVAFGRSRA